MTRRVCIAAPACNRQRYTPEVHPPLEDIPLGSLHILGPSAAAIEKIQTYFRYHVLLKSSKEKDASGNHLRSALKKAMQQYKETSYGKSNHVKMIVDVDPVGMM